ncbi:MAG: hypothetical protein IPN59_06825 [Holophaga sp.]|nr:hypothetical protein [Holophaga sp.]
MRSRITGSFAFGLNLTLPRRNRKGRHGGPGQAIQRNGEGFALCFANFAARIVGEVVRDDGAEKQTFLSVEGRLDSGRALEKIEVPSPQFSGLGWIIGQWGAGAVVFAGNGIKDHLRAALQLLSGSPARRVIYAHTGWRMGASPMNRVNSNALP